MLTEARIIDLHTKVFLEELLSNRTGLFDIDEFAVFLLLYIRKFQK